MPRSTSRKEIHHQPTTHELLLCLESMPKWVEILLQNSDKAFCPFIKWYSSANFYKERTDRVTIKQLAKDYRIADSVKITKWISEAYNEILLLHMEQPGLFSGTGIKITCYCKNFNDSATLVLWFPSIPRMYDEIRVEFLKASLGVAFFWVEKVSFSFENDGTDVTLYLKGGFPNQYRHVLLQRAEFEGLLSLQELHFNTDYENDKELLDYYRR